MFVGFSQRQRRRDRNTVRVGLSAPHTCVVRVDDGHGGVGHRQARVESGDKDECVLRAVLHRQTHVGGLDDRRARTVVDGRGRTRDGCARLHRRPHQPRSRGRQHGRQVHAVCLDRIGPHVETTLSAGAVGCEAEPGLVVLGLQPTQRGHQGVWCDALQPLGDRGEVARGEGQHRPATAFPHTVTITKTHKRALAFVLDDADPGVAEALAIGGCE